VTERTFTIHEACAAAGITAACLHQWIERGQFVPLRDTQSGRAREYTLRDIVHLAAIVELDAAGLSVSSAVELLGTSPMETAGRQTVIARRANTEIRLNLAAVTDRVRTALL